MANNTDKQMDTATLSTHGKLSTFNEGLKKGLANGRKIYGLDGPTD